MTALAGNTYAYDANGNQITRIIGADTFNLKYDADCEAPLWGNRLVEVKKNNAVIAAFTGVYPEFIEGTRTENG